MMPSNDLDEILKSIDAMIRHGDGLNAQSALRKLGKKPIERRYLLRFAALSRRAGLSLLGLRVLNPLVRSQNLASMTASVPEQIEYAASLIRIGAGEEALEILEDCENVDFPETDFFKALAKISTWDYESAIPLLTKYLKSKEVTGYQKIIGKVNLAAAFIYESHYESAEKMLAELREETAVPGYQLLNGNSLELSAQNAIAGRRWEDARRFLELAEDRLSSTQSLDAFFVRKWDAILQLQRSGPCQETLFGLTKIKNEARQRENWETIRDCDRYEAIATKNTKLLLHLYFGTPFRGFRKKLLRDYNQDVEIPETYSWILGKGKPLKGINTYSGEILGGTGELKCGSLLHRFLISLTADFYRPQRVAPLYSKLYPSEHFNPASSPLRVYQAVIRFRKWLKVQHLPLKIVEKNGTYLFTTDRSFEFFVLSEASPIIKLSPPIKLLADKWKEKTFTLKEAKDSIGGSLSSTLRLIQKAKAGGILESEGNSVATRYRFKKSA